MVWIWKRFAEATALVWLLLVFESERRCGKVAFAVGRDSQNHRPMAVPVPAEAEVSRWVVGVVAEPAVFDEVGPVWLAELACVFSFEASAVDLELARPNPSACHRRHGFAERSMLFHLHQDGAERPFFGTHGEFHPHLRQARCQEFDKDPF